MLVLILPPFWAFGLSFFFQSVYFQNGNTDISSFGFLIILLRLIIKKKINFSRLLHDYTSIKLFFTILLLNVLWSFSWGENAKEFIIASIRMIISIISFAYFINEKRDLKYWLIVIIIPFIFITLHNYLLYNEIHPLYETVKDFGRLSGRTITGEMLNSNQASYTLFCLFVIFFLKYNFGGRKNTFFWKYLLISFAFFVLMVGGFLGSRTVIFSTLLIIPLLFFDIKYVIILTLFSLLFLVYTDISNTNIPFIGEAANERIREIGTEEVSTESEMSRAIIYTSGLKIFYDNILFGVGTGKIMETMSLNKYLGKPMMLHNAFLDFAIQFGLMGVFVTIWIINLGVKISKINLNLGFVFFLTILLPNFGHNFFLISLTPMLFLLIEFYSKKIDIIKSA